MSLRDYDVKRDKFEEERPAPGPYSFPCCCCKHRGGSDAEEPCRTCDHNVGAVAEQECGK